MEYAAAVSFERWSSMELDCDWYSTVAGISELGGVSLQNFACRPLFLSLCLQISLTADVYSYAGESVPLR